MKRSFWVIHLWIVQLVLLTAFSFAFTSNAPVARVEEHIAGISNPTQNRLDAEQKVKTNYGRLPLRFEPNQGEHDLSDSVKYFTRAGAMSLFLTDSVAVFSLNRPQVASNHSADPHDKNYEAAKMRQPVDESTSAYLDSLPDGVAIYMRWLGGAAPLSEVEIEASDKQEGVTNYFIGNDPAKWRTNIAGYGKATYKEVYPGIGLAFYGNNGQIEYDFIVEPLADPTQIRLSFEGADSLRLNEKGELILGTQLGEIRQGLPHIYQQQGNQKKVIAGHYLLREKEANSLPEVGFEVESYDPTLPLIIDPLVYSTYLGGTDDDDVSALAVDGSGNAYVVGESLSVDFPTTAGAFNTSYNGGETDAFVTKLNASGSALVYSTYLGGSDKDDARAIAVDGSGNAYIAGDTGSDNFPTTAGAFDTNLNRATYVDAFVTKLNASGTALEYATYLGGTGSDYAVALVVDSGGTAYVVGYTVSDDFPTTAGAFDTIWNGDGGFDVFVTKLNTNGTALLYSTYLGGSADDFSREIKIDGSGNAYVTGVTYSINFSITAGAVKAGLNAGSTDAFVSKLNASGSALIYSTYLGGIDKDSGSAIEVDGSGNLYIAGSTESNNFPTTPGAYDTSYNGGNGDAFISKLNATGTALLYSTYLGGSDVDYATAIALDGSGNIYICGNTSSDNFPTSTGSFDNTLNSDLDGFVTRLNSTGSILEYSSYLGGNQIDITSLMLIDQSGNVYIAGDTSSTNFPITVGAYATNYNGGKYDGFVTKLEIISSVTYGNILPEVYNVWKLSDLAVASGQVSRSWLWGPDAFATNLEDYAEAPGGRRSVQYFDKARMELTNPNADRTSQYFVTNGLLPRELISGKIQLGNNTFLNFNPAKISVAGDPGGSITYDKLLGITTLSPGQNVATNRTGQPVTASIDRLGTVSQTAALGGVTLAAYIPETGHNIPNVFVDYFKTLPQDWLFVMGYPLSEPYITDITLAGKPTTAMVQVFERRVLTYTPSNPAAYRVEQGNVGRHYYQWRYGGN